MHVNFSQVALEGVPIRMKWMEASVVAVDQTVPEGVVVEAVATLAVPVEADLTPVEVVVDRTTMAKSNPTRLALVVPLVT